MRILNCPLSVLLLVIPANMASAQDVTGVPPAVVASWSQLIGEWKVAGQVGSSSVTGSACFEWADGRHCYLGRQVWKIGDSGRNVHLALVGGWDAAEKATVEQGFSSAGGAATVRYQPPTEDANVIEGSIDGVSGPNARWAGTVKLEHNGPSEFQLTTKVNGETVHSLGFTRKQADSSSKRESHR